MTQKRNYLPIVAITINFHDSHFTYLLFWIFWREIFSQSHNHHHLSILGYLDGWCLQFWGTHPENYQCLWVLNYTLLLEILLFKKIQLILRISLEVLSNAHYILDSRKRSLYLNKNGRICLNIHQVFTLMWWFSVHIAEVARHMPNCYKRKEWITTVQHVLWWNTKIILERNTALF